MSRSPAAAAVMAALALAGCQSEPPPASAVVAAPAATEILSLAPVAFADIAGWTADDQSQALPALAESCDRLVSHADDYPVGPAAGRAVGADRLAGTVADWRPLCAALAGVPKADATAARRFVEAAFEPFAVSGRDGPDGLFTGYYEVELHGSRRPDAAHPIPVYRRPDDLVTADLGAFRADWKGVGLTGRVVGGRLTPYPTRADIAAGALARRGQELLWVSDPIDEFFLEIQGSGRVLLDDGGIVRIGYAAQNGRDYVPIGRDLAARGELARDQVSMQTIRDWLAAHPDRAAAEMALNPSVVFFREIAGDGPVGAQGARLTAGRSLAIDPSFLALGAPVWLDVDLPRQPGGRLRRLMVAQDVGGAIKGPVRGDVFWGSGADAAALAGPMKQRGRLILLLPRAVAERRRLVS